MCRLQPMATGQCQLDIREVASGNAKEVWVNLFVHTKAQTMSCKVLASDQCHSV